MRFFLRISAAFMWFTIIINTLTRICQLNSALFFFILVANMLQKFEAM